jgi:hypothetical protein
MRSASALVVGGALLAGCASVWGFDDLTAAGDASAGNDASTAESGADQQAESNGFEASGSSGGSASSSSGSSSGGSSGGSSSGSGSSSSGSGSGSGGSSSGSSSGSASSSSGSSSGGQTGTDCPGSFLLCDGFESDSIDTTTKWQESCTSPGSLGIGTIAHTGSYSLHVHMGAAGASLASCVLQTKPPIFSSTPRYFRAWIYSTVFAGAPGNETFITAQSSNSVTGSMGIGSTGNYITQVANDGAYDYTNTSQTSPVLPTDTWVCLELEIDTSYTTGQPNGLLAAWDNTSGTADPQLGGTAELQPLTSASFGLSFVGPSNDTDLYIDDIAISDTYVPCSE